MVTPLERAYQLTVLAQSSCPGCRRCAEALIQYPDAIKLICHVCGSACEPARPWARLAFASDRTYPA